MAAVAIEARTDVGVYSNCLWSLGAPVPAPNEPDNEIFTAQIETLYRQLPMVLAVNLVNAALVAGVLGSYLGDDRWWLFFILVAILTAVRGLSWARYRARQSESRNLRRWAALATIGSVLSGLIWGGAGGLCLPQETVGQTFVAFVIGGMCAGALASLSYHLPAFVGYLAGAILPLAARFLLEGGPMNAGMSALLVVFAIALTFAAANVARSFRRGFQLQAELRRRTEALSAANGRLQAEIIEREAAEDQLRQAQKLEALGQLTGGIAHDFNNLLTAVVGHIELAQARLSHDARTMGLLRGALSAAERGAALTHRLLAFARRQHLEPRSVDVTAVVGELERLLKQTLGPAIHLVVHAEPGLCPARVDPDQLAVAILNLALNARDAMPGGGTLRITSAMRHAERHPANLASGEYVVVSVSDSGTGMDKETAARAFEPFFTTKEMGRGSGLGLSMVQGFAVQSGGAVDIESAVGRGTNVQLWLPRADGPPPELDPPKRPTTKDRPARGRILVCDDDAEVRAFVSTALSEHGYTVWEANDPRAALQILETEQPIDLLLADYAMPDMTGTEMIERARRHRPDLKAVLMTGHADALQSGGPAGVPLLPKPFNVADLNERVDQTLSFGDR